MAKDGKGKKSRKGIGGRKSKYESHVRPHFDEIEEWLNNGATEAQIAVSLGIAESTLHDYKNKYPEFAELFKKKRSGLISELRGALVKRAMGYEYEEVTTFIKQQGGNQVQTVEKRRKHQPPDVAALNLALKNYDETWHNDDMSTIKMKEQELELKKQKAEAEQW